MLGRIFWATNPKRCRWSQDPYPLQISSHLNRNWRVHRYTFPTTGGIGIPHLVETTFVAQRLLDRSSVLMLDRFRGFAETPR